MRTYFRTLLNVFSWTADFLVVIFVVVGIPLGYIDYMETHKPLCSLSSDGEVISSASIPEDSHPNCLTQEGYEVREFNFSDALRFLGVALATPTIFAASISVFVALDED